MKKIFLIMAAIILTEIVVLSVYKEIIFNYSKVDYALCEELMKPTTSLSYFSSDEKEIKYDEDYALNASIIIYKQLYGVEYNKDNFIAENIMWVKPSWNVYLKNTTKQNIKEYRGIIIDKDNGGVLVNFGE